MRKAVKRGKATKAVANTQKIVDSKPKDGKTFEASKLSLHRLKRRGGGVRVSGEITLLEILAEIKSGKYANVSKARIPGFLCNRFAPGEDGTVYNRVAALESITGIWTFDFDVKNLKRARAIRDNIINCPFILASFLSISGKSAKAIGYVPPPPYSLRLVRAFDAEKYRIEEMYYTRLCEKVLPYIPGETMRSFDMSVGRLHMPVWLSSDSELKTTLL